MEEKKKEKKKKEISKGKKAVRGILIAFLVLVVLILGAAGFGWFYVNREYKPAAEKMVKELDLEPYPSQHATTLYYLNQDSGEWNVMETLFDGQDNEWVPYDELPKSLKDATLAIEDKRFFEHHGVDWQRTINAAWEYFVKKNPNSPGGSSLTQQLVKNLTQNTEETANRKITEIFAALELEKELSKEEIMEQYLNRIYYANNCIGAYRGSIKYFAKDVRDLNATEAALLIAIPNRPDYYDPYRYPEHTKERAAIILTQMYDQGKLTKEETDEALSQIGYTFAVNEGKKDTEKYQLTYHPEEDTFEFRDGSIQAEAISENSEHVYSWYTDAVLDRLVIELMETQGVDSAEANRLLYEGGLKVYTCLDTYVQAVVDQEFSNLYLNEFNWAWNADLPPQSAITVVDNATGAVIALSGGLGPKETSRMWNRATDSVRPSGSSIKPLGVYGPALDLGLVTPQTVVEDSMFRLDNQGNPWPVNADGIYSGSMTIHDALVRSVNTVAVKTLDMVGLERSYQYLTDRFHLSSLVPQDMDYAPLALGGFTYGVSTYDMAAAFSVFPRHGVYKAPHLFTQVLDYKGNVLIEHGNEAGEQALSPEAADTMTSILKDAVSYGTGAGANLYYMDAAGKTGTTSNSYDLWFCGFTPYYTAAVWSGYDSQIAMGNSGSNPSVSIWRDIMSVINADKPYEPLAQY